MFFKLPLAPITYNVLCNLVTGQRFHFEFHSISLPRFHLQLAQRKLKTQRINENCLIFHFRLVGVDTFTPSPLVLQVSLIAVRLGQERIIFSLLGTIRRSKRTVLDA